MKTITTTYNPETHQLVPKTLTPEMKAAAIREFTLPRIWDAMLAAAPQQEEREECDCPAEKMPFGRCCKSQASLGQAWHGAAQWLRNNYQDHPNITSLCEAMVGAAPQGDKVAPWNWRMVLPGGLKTDKWDSARVGDYNNGWNAYRTKAVAALESLEAHQPPPAKAEATIKDSLKAQAEGQEAVAKDWRHVIPGGRKTDQWESVRVDDYNRGWNDYRKAAKAALEQLQTSARQEPIVEFMGRRLTPEGTRECWGILLCDFMQDPEKGTKLYTAPPRREWVKSTLEEKVILLLQHGCGERIPLLVEFEELLKGKNHG